MLKIDNLDSRFQHWAPFKCNEQKSLLFLRKKIYFVANKWNRTNYQNKSENLYTRSHFCSVAKAIFNCFLNYLMKIILLIHLSLLLLCFYSSASLAISMLFYYLVVRCCLLEVNCWKYVMTEAEMSFVIAILKDFRCVKLVIFKEF